MRGWAAAGVLMLSLLPRAVHAGEALQGVKLEVTRSAAAEDCPDAASLGRAVAQHLTEPAAQPLIVHVAIDKDAAAYLAEMRVSGPWQGVRTLQLEGQTCGPLAEALTVALALLLDPNAGLSTNGAPEAWFPDVEEHPGEAKASSTQRSAPPDSPPSAPESQVPAAESELVGAMDAEPSSSSPENATGTGAPPRHWQVGLGPTLLVGVLPRASVGASGGAVWRHDGWQIEAGGGWFPAQQVHRDGGTVTVDFRGARAGACLMWPGRAAWQVGGCGLFVGGILRGRATNFDENRTVHRFFGALGAGGHLHAPLAGPFGWTLRLDGLLPLQQETFSIEGLGPLTTTRRLGAWAALEVHVRIW